MLSYGLLLFLLSLSAVLNFSAAKTTPIETKQILSSVPGANATVDKAFRQFYGPYGRPSLNYNQFGQFGGINPYQQYPGNFIPGQGYLRPPISTVAPAVTTTTAATTTTATTTTTRPVQPGVTTLFPLVGNGTGFQRPGNTQLFPGIPQYPQYPQYPQFGQYPYFGKKK